MDGPSLVNLADPNVARKVLDIRHPDYTRNAGNWAVLLDAFESSGGFLDGTYLWPYPREDEADFQRRKTMARYHDYLSSLVDIYVRMVCAKVARSSDDERYLAWSQDVDGGGTRLDALVRQWLTLALVHGHAGVLVDRTPDAPLDQTASGERSRIVAHVFSALAITDWRHEHQTLTGVKLSEQPRTASLLQPVATEPDTLIWTLAGWLRFSADAKLLASDELDLGLVPFVVLRPKPRYTSEMLGRPLIGHANLIRAMFNRASEEDQVIRDQAFSVLTVSVPEDGNVDEAKLQLGSTIGTAKALVVRGTIDYKTPDQAVPGTIRQNISYLVRELYRAAHVRYESEGLAAESGSSIRLQYTELNEALQGVSSQAAAAEQHLARAFFAWLEPTPDAAEAAYAKARIEARYPTEFITDDLISDLEAWAEAVRMDLGLTMTKRIKKKAVGRLDPNIPAEELVAIHQEIDEQKAEVMEPIPMPLDRGIVEDSDAEPDDDEP